MRSRALVPSSHSPCPTITAREAQTKTPVIEIKPDSTMLWTTASIPSSDKRPGNGPAATAATVVTATAAAVSQSSAAAKPAASQRITRTFYCGVLPELKLVHNDRGLLCLACPVENQLLPQFNLLPSGFFNRLKPEVKTREIVSSTRIFYSAYVKNGGHEY